MARYYRKVSDEFANNYTRLIRKYESSGSNMARAHIMRDIMKEVFDSKESLNINLNKSYASIKSMQNSKGISMVISDKDEALFSKIYEYHYEIPNRTDMATALVYLATLGKRGNNES